MIEWLKQQYNKMLSNAFPILPSYIARDCRDEFKEIYGVGRLTENKRFEYEVTDTGQYYFDNGKRIFPEDFWQIIHDLNEENEQLKSDNNRLVNETARIVAEHQRRVLDLIDEKIEHYQKQPALAVRIPINCEHRKSCLHNQEVNVCNKAKENAYRELKKELQE